MFAFVCVVFFCVARTHLTCQIVTVRTHLSPRKQTQHMAPSPAASQHSDQCALLSLCQAPPNSLLSGWF